MTLEEAKKILEKEFAVISLHKSTEPFEFDESGWIEHEKPSVLEAFRVLSKGGYYISISGHDYNMREKRLKKELEEHANAPVSGKEKAKKGNPALKEAASQFNDALLDEQAKEIECLRDKCKKLVDILDSVRNKLRKLKAENSRIKNSDLNLEGLINATRELKEKNKEIAELTKENEDLKSWRENLNREISLNTVSFINETKRLGKEISKLNSIIHDKNAVLADVAEELRLTKIREKNLAELGLKYVGENEKLKKKLADKIVDEIDARALKSAESALAYKEKVIAEKDEVIADLGNELAATKKELEEKTKLVETVRKGSKEYCEYGISAEKMIRKMANVIVYEGKVSSKEFEEYRRWANGYRFNPQLYDFIEEEEKKLEHAKKIRVSSDNAEEGADLYGVIVLRDKDYIDALKKAKDTDIWQE